MARWQRLLLALSTTLWAGQACADSTETRVTPKNVQVNGLSFQVTARDAGESKSVEVVIKATVGKELSPFLAGRLALYQGKRLVLSCAVEPNRSASALRYQFQVAAKDVDEVQFRFNEFAFAKRVDEKGGVTFIPMPSVDSYWFSLNDFVSRK